MNKKIFLIALTIIYTFLPALAIYGLGSFKWFCLYVPELMSMLIIIRIFEESGKKQ